MFKEYLLSTKNNNIPISLYTDSGDTESYDFGFVQGVSDEWVLLANISITGFCEGFIIVKHEDIYRCEIKDKYGEKLYRLFQIRNQKQIIMDTTSGNLLYDLIQYAQKNQFVVSIELYDSDCKDVVGFVTGIQDDTITIEQLDYYGNADGESIIYFKDITYIACDTETERSIKLLADNQ